jgi:hypothetical protein
MWLAVVWLVALVPNAALSYAIEVRRLFRMSVDAPKTIEATAGQWLIAVTMFLMVLATGRAMYTYAPTGRGRSIRPTRKSLRRRRRTDRRQFRRITRVPP